MADGATITVSLVGEHPVVLADVLAGAEAHGGTLPLDLLYDYCKASEAKARALAGKPFLVDRSGAMPRSVEVGNVILRSISVAGQIALRRLIALAGELDQTAYDVAEAWVYASSWDMAELSRFTDLTSLSEIIDEFAANLTCTREDLVEAVERINAMAFPETEGADDGEGNDAMQFVDAFAKRYGSDPLAAMGLPMSTMAHVLDAAAKLERHQTSKSYREAGKQPPPSADEKLATTAAFEAAKKAMKGEPHG